MNLLVGTAKTSAMHVSVFPPAFFHDLLTIQFLESKLLSLSDEAEYHAPSNNVEPGIETN